MKKETNNKLLSHYGTLLGLIPPWAVVNVDLDVAGLKVTIHIEYPGGERVTCPECGRLCRIKDHRKERTWRHLDTMQFQTTVKSRLPRSDCPVHGAKTIQAPWAGPKSRFTLLFEKFAIDVLCSARSIKQAQKILGLSWDQIQLILKLSVERGLSRRKLNDLTYVGLDEKSFGKGHDYISVLTDLEKARVLDVVQGRAQEEVDPIWQTIPEYQRVQIRAVAMDMWEAFMNSARDNVPQAKIVHDKFHVVKYLGKAVDDVRKRENRQLSSDGYEVLKGTKYLWLTNPKNWSGEQEMQFSILQTGTLKVGRAWSIKEAFSRFWEYYYKGSATKFFQKWYYWATHSRLKPVVKVAKILKRHLKGLLAYIEHKITNAVTEGLNSKIQSIKANARGFRNFNNYRLAILFHCGKLELYP